MGFFEDIVRRNERPAMGNLLDSAQNWLLKITEDSLQSHLVAAIEAGDKLCESEIEKMFLLAWVATVHRGIIEPHWAGWAVRYDIIGDENYKTQDQAYREMMHDRHLDVAPTPNRIGLSRKDYIFPQLTIDQYRADFVLVRWEINYDVTEDAARRIVDVKHTCVCRPLVVVECDGHDFHEKTKEQAQRDKARDRHFAAAGFHVLRFTGSEIYRDAMKCAAEVEKFFHDSEYPSGYKGRGI